MARVEEAKDVVTEVEDAGEGPQLAKAYSMEARRSTRVALAAAHASMIRSFHSPLPLLFFLSSLSP
eukprot:6196732-Pleurochrysis_carterae.AAC.2